MDLFTFQEACWRYIRRIGENLQQICEPVCQQFGLTILQLQLLSLLRHEGPHSVSSLAGSLGREGANVSTMCKKLEQEGMLQRVRSSEDERVVLLILTTQGKEVVAAADQAFQSFLDKLPKEEAHEGFQLLLCALERLDQIFSNSAIRS